MGSLCLIFIILVNRWVAILAVSFTEDNITTMNHEVIMALLEID